MIKFTCEYDELKALLDEGNAFDVWDIATLCDEDNGTGVTANVFKEDDNGEVICALYKFEKQGEYWDSDYSNSTLVNIDFDYPDWEHDLEEAMTEYFSKTYSGKGT